MCARFFFLLLLFTSFISSSSHFPDTEDLGEEDEVITIPDTHDDVIMELIFEYLCRHDGTKPPSIPKPLPSTGLNDVCSAQDCEFMTRVQALGKQMVYTMTREANYLDIPSLLDLCCAKIASWIKGMSWMLFLLAIIF